MTPGVRQVETGSPNPPENLIVFDGDCVLCSRFFRFILARDRDQVFAFATAQSPLGQWLYRDHNLPTDHFETNLVFVRGQLHMRLDAFAAAMGQLGWPWRGFAALRFLPRWIKDPVYSGIARNRYRLFGRFDTCMIPDPELRARFAPDGF